MGGGCSRKRQFYRLRRRGASSDASMMLDVEDEIIAQRDALIESLQQKTESETLFTVRWKVN